MNAEVVAYTLKNYGITFLKMNLNVREQDPAEFERGIKLYQQDSTVEDQWKKRYVPMMEALLQEIKSVSKAAA